MSIHAHDSDWDDHYTATPDEHPPPAGASGTSAKDEREPNPPTPMFSTLQAWVGEFLAPTITAEFGPGMRWCPQWWRHPEAVSRLEALWRAWETCRVAPDPTAMSTWWRDHADHHLEMLMEGTRSPFRQCSAEPGRGHRDDLSPLPIDPVPPGWFNDDPPPAGPIAGASQSTSADSTSTR